MNILCRNFVLLIVISIQTAHADQARHNLDHDGLTRWYQIYTPESLDRDQPTPLLLALHGRPGNGQRTAATGAGITFVIPALRWNPS